MQCLTECRELVQGWCYVPVAFLASQNAFMVVVFCKVHIWHAVLGLLWQYSTGLMLWMIGYSEVNMHKIVACAKPYSLSMRTAACCLKETAESYAKYSLCLFTPWVGTGTYMGWELVLGTDRCESALTYSHCSNHIQHCCRSNVLTWLQLGVSPVSLSLCTTRWMRNWRVYHTAFLCILLYARWFTLTVYTTLSLLIMMWMYVGYTIPICVYLRTYVRTYVRRYLLTAWPHYNCI